MVDIENYVFTKLEEAIHEQYPEAVVVGDYIEELASFPTITINEIMNATLRRMQDEEPTEHYATVTYEVNVYCDDRLGKKAKCKAILDIVDGVMFGMKFTKGLTRRLPSVNNTRTIYRMYSRYTAVVDEGTVETGEDGEETIVYHTYRG